MERDEIATEDRSLKAQGAAEDDAPFVTGIKIYLRVRPVQDPTELLELSTEDGRATFRHLKSPGLGWVASGCC